MLNQQFHQPCVTTPVTVIYKFGKPDKRERDVFNLEKAVSDLLVSHGVIKDDTLIHRGIVEWEDIEGCDIVIVPYKVKDSEWWAGFVE